MWKWYSVVIFYAVCQTEANGVFETARGFMAERVEWATLHDFCNSPVKVIINWYVNFGNVGAEFHNVFLSFLFF